MNDNGKLGGKPTTPKPRIKKSETLEVRIPHETKQAFLTACREDGTTASEVVRDQVQTYLDAREQPPQQEKRTLVMQFSPTVRRYGPRVAAGSLAALGLTALAVLPSAAAPDIKAQFARLDVNGDGVLSVDEFLGPKDATIKTDGVGGSNNIVIQTRSIVTSDKDGDKPPAVVTDNLKSDAFTFWLPDELSPQRTDKPGESQKEFKFISRQEVKTLKDGETEPTTSTETFTFSVDDLKKKEFTSIDANGDGQVSLDEYRIRQTAMLTRGFQMLDDNSDKALSEAEYAKIVSPMIKISMKDGSGAADVPKIDIPGMSGVTPEMIKSAFTKLDTNKDGKLSLQEYLPKA